MQPERRNLASRAGKEKAEAKATHSPGGRRNRLKPLTKHPEGDIQKAPKGSPARGKIAYGGIRNAQWYSMVEGLLELTEADFEAAVLAVRLYRRFEAGSLPPS